MCSNVEVVDTANEVVPNQVKDIVGGPIRISCGINDIHGFIKNNKTLIKNPKWCDMWFHLIDENILVPAHRCIVATGCTFLYELLTGKKPNKSKAKRFN